MPSVSGISQAATSVSRAQLANKVDYAVLQKHQESSKQQGEAVVELIQDAVDIGDRIDIKA